MLVKQMASMVQTIPLKVPCYLVKAGNGFLLIDSGDASDRAKLVQALERAGVTPGTLHLVLLTHGDFDHTGNAAFLRETYGGKIAMHAADAEMAVRGDQGANRRFNSDHANLLARVTIFILMRMIKTRSFERFSPDVRVDDGFDLSGYGFDARVVHIPGHTKGSVGVLTAEGDFYCGDLLTNMIRPGLHFFLDDLTESRASVEKIRRLPVKTIYPGHGRPFEKESLP